MKVKSEFWRDFHLMQKHCEIYGIIDSAEIEINPRELEQRLGLRKGTGYEELKFAETDIFEECRKDLFEAAVCRYSIVKTGVSIGEESCDFGAFSIKSRDLRKNLGGCNEAWLMGVTLGPGVDRLLTRLALKSAAGRFITDAYASAMVEALADRVEEYVRRMEAEALKESESGFRQNLLLKPRYSPGYGDCSIENQRELLKRLHAKERLGISLDESCFMKPVKSISAIIGVRDRG